MPRETYGDFDEFAEALNGVAGRFMTTAQSETDWWVEIEPIGSVIVQQVQAGGPTAFVGDGRDGSITIGLPSSTPEHIRANGRALSENGFILVNEGQPFTLSAQQPTRWLGITIPTSHPYLPSGVLRSASSAGREQETHIQAELRHIAAAKATILRMLSSESRIDLLEEGASRAAEEELLLATRCILESARGNEDVRGGRPSYSRARVISRALALIEAREGKPLFLQDLCRATQVSERTLRNVFQEYFGIGPMRFLKVNRLREIRAALIAADAREDSVWRIATRFGIWDLSAFAHDYKALFGELPHQTLRVPGPANRDEDAMNMTWIRYASRKLAEASALKRG
jgi:AraC family transcriptional regulator, ethanolamine operon transcriptional activator